MKKILIPLFLALATVATIATQVFSFYPPNIVGSNPQQTGVFYITNTAVGTYSFTNTFPFPFISAPAMTFYVNSANAEVNILTNTITSTNFIVTSGNTNCSISWTANLPYIRILTGINSAGAIVSSAVSVTNVFSPPFTSIPVINVEGSGALYATNAGVWASSVTTSNMVITTGNTNQIIYWGAFGPSAAPGYNVVTY